MPELPEVESVRRGLEAWVGHRIENIKLNDPKLLFEGTVPIVQFQSAEVKQVLRRGKYLVITFSNKLAWISHLRMTGKWLPLHSPAIPAHLVTKKRTPASLQIRITFNVKDIAWCFYDTRRFGTLTTTNDLDSFWSAKEIAPDPITHSDDSLNFFLSKIYNSNRSIKSFLLNQSCYAGAGNIYVDEALFACRIHPDSICSAIEKPERLWHSLHGLFLRSISDGGTSIINYRNASGEAGRFAKSLKVYGKAGQPCHTCGRALSSSTIAGRTSHYCARCQKLLFN